jgi:hypothetical protein
MFVSNHAQILLHLGQFTPKRQHTVRKQQKNNLEKNVIKKIENCEIQKNHKAILNKIREENFLMLHVSKISVENILSDILQKNAKTEALNEWSSQYVIKNSFSSFDNNATTIRKTLGHQWQSGANTLMTSFKLQQPLMLMAQQLRTFKTERSVESQEKRNPRMFSRIHSWFGGSPPTLLKMDPTLIASAQNQQPGQEETIMRLLTNNPSLTDDEKQRIKVSFAEGYLAASNPETVHKSGRAMKYLKVFQQLLVIVVFMGILLSLFSSTNGSMFRIQLGNQVEVDPEEITITFAEVKGCDEAKQELQEVVEFLKNPDKFSNLGGKLPKGVLLVGPPGTGNLFLSQINHLMNSPISFVRR